MNRISGKEFEGLEIKYGRGLKPNPIRDAILALKIGEGLIVNRSEYKEKYVFSTYIHAILRINKLRGLSIKVVTLLDNTGWAIKLLSQGKGKGK